MLFWGGVRPGMWEIKNAMVLCDDNIVLKEAVAVTGLHEDSYGGAYMRLRAKTAAEETALLLYGGVSFGPAFHVARMR